MQKIIKYISCLLFLLVFMFPTVYQFGHSFVAHYHTEYHTSDLSEYQFMQSCEDESCPVCSFEFAVFEQEDNKQNTSIQFTSYSFSQSLIQNFTQSVHLKNTSLRAPPEC